MSVQIHFEDLMEKREMMPMYRTPFPKWGRRDVQTVVETFRIKGRIRDEGSRFVVKNRNRTLEIFKASDSVRWIVESSRESELQKAVKLPLEKEARKLADTFLNEKKLKETNAAFKSISYSEIAWMHKGEKEERAFTVALHVNYEFSLRGQPVMGSGAKMQVTVGSFRRIIEFYRFWRNPVLEKEMRVIPFEKVIEVLRADEAFADLPSKKGYSVKFTRPRLGYYSLPPRESQGYLLPVYAFDGEVITPHLEEYKFTKYVVAVDIKPEEVKKVGAIFTMPSNILS